MSTATVQREFFLSANCQVQIPPSLFLPLRSIQIIRSVNEEYVIESANFHLTEWKEFIDDVPFLIMLSNSLKKNKSLDFFPLEKSKQDIWDLCEFQTSRFVGKLIPFTSIFGTKETLLRLRGYTIDAWGKIHPTEVGLDLWHEELLSLNEQRQDIATNISYLEQICPPYSTKNPFGNPSCTKQKTVNE